MRSLYTNIPHEEGIKAVEGTIKTSPDKSKTTMISTLLRFILMLNNFVFNGRRIYPFNKGLRIYGGGVPPPF